MSHERFPGLSLALRQLSHELFMIEAPVEMRRVDVPERPILMRDSIGQARPLYMRRAAGVDGRLRSSNLLE
jgi:hypothetical protein